MNVGQAKAIPIDRLLATLGFQPKFEKKGELWYSSPFRPGEEEPSFHVTPSRLGWKDFGNGERGGNILDFVMLYFKLGNNLSAALTELDRIMGSQPELFTPQRPAPQPQASTTSAPPPVSRVKKGTPQPPDLKITKVQVIAHPALIGYLNTRGINGQLARQHLKEIHFTQHGKSYFALGFENDSGGYELRNPYYQGSTAPKDITSIELTRIGYGDKTMAVFEGFFDYLSALALHIIIPQTPAIVMNTAAMKERAKTAILAGNPASVHLYLDRDDTGRQLAAYFQQELKGMQVLDQSGQYERYKDLNEYHIAYRREQLWLR